MTGWEYLFRELVKHARMLPEYPPQYRDQAHQVSGCEAKVWLALETTPERQLRVFLDSDSRVVKGLLYQLWQACDQQPVHDVAALAVDDLLAQQQLDKQLSPARIQGFSAVAKELTRQAQLLADA
ncbi:(Fe-S)-binding protein [Idiomarina tyrosinivorans]|uniref:(Fe-S)-binding protein n=1 Tax=Idiomarina tyrosinivorans TaxID=1445662 RepID=A0A432ZQZ8_9GAMM|nr:SufE family protein [Idiomarina tyrosinivorans]RUO80330.1 (Fe-S)-binding protein [Idiomarina tyrosinivorans]